MTNGTLLSVENLHVSYGPIPVLRGVSVDVPASGISAIIGPNGAGKSTLLKAIFGFARAHSGTVVFGRDEVTNFQPEALFTLGMRYVEQGRSICPDLTVLENLQIATYREKNRRRAAHAIDEILNRFPVLKDKLRERALSLSGGEARMLELGRAFMFEPRLILLDEPSLGLAPSLVQQLATLIQEFAQERGAAFLIVEQNIRAALDIAKRCFVLDLGQKVFEGAPAELRADTRLTELYVGGDAK